MIKEFESYIISGVEDCNHSQNDIYCTRWEVCCKIAPKCCEDQRSLYAFWYFWFGFAASVLLLLVLIVCSSVVWCKKNPRRRRRHGESFVGETVIRIQNMVNSRTRGSQGESEKRKSPLSTIRDEGYITTRTENPGGIIRPSVHGQVKWYPDASTKAMGVLSAQTHRGMNPLDPAYPPVNPIKLTRVTASEISAPVTYDDDYTEIVLPPGYVITPEKPFVIPPV